MTHMFQRHPRFAAKTMLVVVASLIVAIPLRAIQTPSASVRQEWVFNSTLVDGQPVFKVARMVNGVETMRHQIRPEDVPFDDVDCELECGRFPHDVCFGRCLRGGLNLLFFDEARGAAYITAKTETGSNVRWVVFKVDVASGKIARVGHSFGSGFQTVGLSPDGRFLSYLMGSNQSAADGVWVLAIMDLGTGVETAPTERLLKNESRPLDMVADVKNYQWQDGSIVFNAVTRPRRPGATARLPRGRVTQYVYAVAEDQLVTARERAVIPKR
jgi:hypothetical protein